MNENGFSIEQINKLDAAAFHSLYKDYYKVLVAHSVQIIGEQEAAEDIVQELFSRIWERQEPFQSLVSLRTYLFNSIRNASLDYLKHKDVENSYLQKVAQEHQEYHIKEMDEEDRFFSEEVYRQLFLAIDALPDRCREVFLHAMQGKKNEEIATALNISLETVKTQKKRGMAFLRKKLDKRTMVLLICGFPHLIQ